MVPYQSPFENSCVQCHFCGRYNVPRHFSNTNEPNICSDCLDRIKWQREGIPTSPIYIPPPVYIPSPDQKISSARGLTKCSCGALFEGFFIEQENSKLIAICPRCQQKYEVSNKFDRDDAKIKKAEKPGIFQFISSVFRGV